MSLFSVKQGGYQRKHKKIFKNINLELYPGEILSILGPNGVGKTTFLKCCMGLLKWSEGASFLNKKDIRHVVNSYLWQNISYVPQAKTIHSGISVLDMVLLGCNPLLNISPKKQHLTLALQTLEELDISHLAKQHCHSLSGGELQMVLIARALVSCPKLLILDEPESNLDFKNQIKILEILKTLSNNKVGILCNTHYPTHALKISHKSLLIYHKENEIKNIYGETSRVLTQENLSQAFDVPLELFAAHLEFPKNFNSHKISISDVL
ncbi:ABC transporter ATP-binding protein [Helicobacter sp. 11S03491-1]|uniref:ABC transporter ATP-binding protein n=1 Tax=Helicobacter sp. 11S03491-1 TaxID=1476196 RepID=UPI000BA55868|nr:ABC transporter ATP-binding protein [Helicobacter sp. 11S03491-1]PAF43433.1 hypothetical protein BKH45_02050 [Helicobacter sp. 11S03491-1]